MIARTTRLHRRRGIGAPTPRGSGLFTAQIEQFGLAAELALAALRKLIEEGLLDADEADEYQSRISEAQAAAQDVSDTFPADDATAEAAALRIAEQQAKLEYIIDELNALATTLPGRRTRRRILWGVGAVAIGLGAAFVWLKFFKRRKKG